MKKFYTVMTVELKLVFEVQGENEGEARKAAKEFWLMSSVAEFAPYVRTRELDDLVVRAADPGWE